MSRSSYSDDYGDEFPGQMELYRGNVMRSIRSKKGQARLRELRDDLLALPTKALQADIFSKPSGEACALGVWAQRHHPQREAVDTFRGEDDDDTATFLRDYWPRLVVMDLVYVNDSESFVTEYHLGPHQNPWDYRAYSHSWPLYRSRPETDEERYARVLAWVNEHIVPPAPPSAPETEDV